MWEALNLIRGLKGIYTENAVCGVREIHYILRLCLICDDRILTYFDLPLKRYKVVKVRLQSTYIGEFVFPAIQCEAMYDASAHARTTAGRVKVSK